MDRQTLVLAALSPAGLAVYEPVQVQKLFFLIDQNIASLVDGPHFSFYPYNYGPFDASVYGTLEDLATTQLIEISHDGFKRVYRLTESGLKAGQESLSSLSGAAQDYIRRISSFVRELSFSQLVSAVYKAYPEMRANSVFQE